MDEGLSAPRQDLFSASPVMNAAGAFGFSPPAHWPLEEPQGVFVTAPISLAPRTPAGGRTVLPYPGGFLLHSGLPNPGLSRVLREHAHRWAQSTLPVWVHLIPRDAAESERMARRLESVENIAALELGLPPDLPGEDCLRMVQAAAGELPVVACLPLDRAAESWIARLAAAGASAVTLGAPRGMLRESTGRVVEGRLFGPALAPQVHAALQRASSWKLPVLAGCGVFSPTTLGGLLEAGAWAVQLDAVLWKGGW